MSDGDPRAACAPCCLCNGQRPHQVILGRGPEASPRDQGAPLLVGRRHLLTGLGRVLRPQVGSSHSFSDMRRPRFACLGSRNFGPACRITCLLACLGLSCGPPRLLGVFTPQSGMALCAARHPECLSPLPHDPVPHSPPMTHGLGRLAADSSGQSLVDHGTSHLPRRHTGQGIGASDSLQMMTSPKTSQRTSRPGRNRGVRYLPSRRKRSASSMTQV